MEDDMQPATVPVIGAFAQLFFDFDIFLL